MKVVTSVRLFDPRRYAGPDKQERLGSYFRALHLLGISNLDVLYGQEGERAYNDRFTASLVDLALEAYDLYPHKQPDSQRENSLELVRALQANPLNIVVARAQWEAQVEETGTVTFRSTNPDRTNHSIVENYVPHGSLPERYDQKMLDAVSAIACGGTVIDMGSGACDNLLHLSNGVARKIGIDNHSLADLVELQIREDSRVRGRGDRETYLRRLYKKGVEFIRGDFMERDFMAGLCTRLPRPIVFLYLNSIVPHFSSPYVEKAFEVGLNAHPDFIIVTGMQPQYEHKTEHGWTHMTPTRFFQTG